MNAWAWAKKRSAEICPDRTAQLERALADARKEAEIYREALLRYAFGHVSLDAGAHDGPTTWLARQALAEGDLLRPVETAYDPAQEARDILEEPLGKMSTVFVPKGYDISTAALAKGLSVIEYDPTEMNAINATNDALIKRAIELLKRCGELQE